MLLLKLAWRNIWRNKRRTLITVTSIVVAVLLSVVMRSMQEGQYEGMIETTVGSFSGYIQVHGSSYWEERTLENSFAASDSLLNELRKIPNTTTVAPRIQSFALGAGREQSRPVMALGIDVEAEKKIIAPHQQLETGRYFSSNNERAVIVGRDVLNRLNMQVGDSLVLLGQGYRGVRATGLYPIKGTVGLISPEMNQSLVLLPIGTAQEFYGAQNRLTAAAIKLDDPEQVQSTVKTLREKLPADKYEVMSWREMMPELVQSIEIDRGSGIIILAVLYMVVGFGILGTVLMMITERTYEFGVMLSVGTPRLRLAGILALEILFVALLGSGIGILISLPITWYFNVNPIQLTGDMANVTQEYGLEPILAFSVEPSIFLWQAVTIFIITLVFSLIPVLRASRLNPVNAMRS